MNVRKMSLAALFASLAAVQAPTQAMETGVAWLRISGFGSVVASRANVDDSEAYYQPAFTSEGGVHDTWSLGTDSRLGIQADARISSSLSATVQAVSRRNEEGAYTPRIEWANLKYQFTPDVSVRVGRIGLAAFLISEYLNVGYSQPWIRPPVEAYRLMPMTHVDGIDGMVRLRHGDTTVTLQGTYGKSDFKAVLLGGMVTDWDVEDVLVANVIAENGPWTLRYGKVYGTNKNSALVPGEEIKDNFNNLGLIYDQGAWLVQGEYIWRKTNKLSSALGKNDMTMGYLTAGYRFGKLMPSLTWGRFIDQSDSGALGTTQTNRSLGVRWDFHQNVALKTQWDHVTRSSSRPGFGYTGSFLTAPSSAFASDDKSVDVVSVGLDFVF